LEQHARELAKDLASATTQEPEDPTFFARFAANAASLRAANAAISQGVQTGERLATDAEWLVDNFYIVEEQLREIEDDLPGPFYRELPKTAAGAARVQSLAIELISHTDSELDEETILRFIRAFQSETPLTMGEVWALPIMLRLVLVENLQRIAAHMLARRECLAQARRLVDLWEREGRVSLDLPEILHCGSLVVCLVEQLQGARPELAERRKELERCLEQHQVTAHQVIHAEHQRQAADQVSIGNVITSMRLISALDWVAFFENTNLTERILRTDPADIYGRMDFESRDRYRHVIERLAKGSRLPETEVATRVVKLASRESGEIERHVGYWLVGAGIERLETYVEYRPRLRHRIARAFQRHPSDFYLTGIGLLTLLVAVVFTWGAISAGVPPIAGVLLGCLALLAASEIAILLVNAVVTRILPPWLLPKLDLQAGLSPEQRTLVVVPSLLTSADVVAGLLDRLEMHYLASADPQLCFALLTDFVDAAQEVMPGDQALLDQVRSGIAALNQRYQRDGVGPFYLFHRRRLWNDRQRKWMGWERKRGKLHELHRLLRRRGATTFEVVAGDCESLYGPSAPPVRYILTLDADTQLPHSAAQRLIGTLAHPLNRPRFEGDGRLIGGYVLLQPRVSIDLGSASRSRFVRLFANNPGIDPYATSASDIYQDLYGEGSFTGKGLYDLDAFEQLLGDAFPENQILSHDLIEGCFSRVALVSDIEVFDEYPPRYEADARRQHRWTRGDWQILPWLFPRVPSAAGLRRNPLSLLSRWKIFDNLRRSLVPVSLLLLLLVGWLATPVFAVGASLMALLVVGIPLLLQLVNGLTSQPRHVSWSDHVRVLLLDLNKTAWQAAFLLGVLPHKAWLMTDAIVRTLYRLAISRRDLLEWETASEVERQMSKSRWSALLHLWFVPALAIVLLLVLSNSARVAAMPFLLLWLSAPGLSHYLAQAPTQRTRGEISPEQRQHLRLEARRIWSFFEAYVGNDGNWLPPDNMQEYPAEKIAYRISPTNEGLFLLSALVARDLGYLSLHNLAALWERNLTSWLKFDRLHGHFYNWYDTATLQPLYPRYVSTVDSGNLAACLLALRQGIDDLRRQDLLAELPAGLRDTVEMIQTEAEGLGIVAHNKAAEPWRSLAQILAKLPEMPIDSDSIAAALESLEAPLAALRAIADPLHEPLLKKLDHLAGSLQALKEEWQTFFGWRASLPAWHDESDATRNIHARLEQVTTLADLCSVNVMLQQALEAAANTPADGECLKPLKNAIEAAAAAANKLDRRLAQLAAQFERLALEMDFRFLFDPQRRLFSIGFNLEEGKLDRSHYDLLCSEARLASYLAVAKGDVEARHWFHLGRQLTQTAGQVALLSWGGTMFEYLMPPLFLRSFDSSLLDQSCRAAIARQQEYGRQSGVPWGVSECAFGALAINSDYHYRSFGVPGLGLKRGLSKDLVISPYSTFLAIEFDPLGALANLDRLASAGGLGHWGYYEALDYTPERVPPGRRRIVVRCHMSHHQGMSLLALGNVLCGGAIRRRFHEHSLIRSSELLLQERVSVAAPKFQPHVDEGIARQELPLDQELVSRKIIGVPIGAPRTHLLSNGEYSVMLSSTGGGYSTCGDLAIARWRPDATRDAWGQFLYFRDRQSGCVWSPTYQPTGVEPDSYEVVYSIDKADFHRRDGELESHLEVAVSPENNAEVRQLRITNHGERPRQIEITSYVEIALTTQQADVSHPAFHKLFVETEYIAEEASLLARRRPRDSAQQPTWAVHTLAVSTEPAQIEYDTSRQMWLGRNRTLQAPQALADDALHAQTGAVLDPIFSLRCTINIPQFESVALGFTTALAASREEALSLADQYHDFRGVHRAFELAWAYAQVELRHLHISPALVHLYQRLATGLLYPQAAYRAAGGTIARNRQGQRDLWRFGISGDLPIVLVHVTQPEQVEIVRELLTAQAYLRGRGLKCDLVILNDYPGSYLDALQDQLVSLINERPTTIAADKRLGVFLLRGAQMSPDDKTLLDASAAVLLQGDKGSLSNQLEAITDELAKTSSPAPLASPPAARPQQRNDNAHAPALVDRRVSAQHLEFWNGLGGFAHEGREYHIRLRGSESTPLPWSNVIANEQFGCLVTESGGGYTWFGNSRENKLTTWANDPISDLPSEGVYLCDEDHGKLFSPLAGIVRDGNEYWVQHGQGYSRFLHESDGIEQELTISIAPDDPVKLVVLRLHNRSSETRRLAVTYVAQWVLGVTREETQMHLVTAQHEPTGALLATNAYHPDFPDQVAFLQVLAQRRQLSGDRAEIFGKFGSLKNPSGLDTASLSDRTGAALDPAGAVQTHVTLSPGQSATVTFLLGAGSNLTAAEQLLEKYSTPEAAERAIEQTQQRWDNILTTIQVKTPNRAFDLLVNRWLLYQTLSCRVWGRSAYYQSGGAYGFRDQLQDVMALVYAEPQIARRHLLRAASRQFPEGDVQHWWHPPWGRGTRTRFSDDLLWLPLAVAHYIAVTQDHSVLDEQVTFITSPPLDEQEQERYELPSVTSESAKLYEHCLRAIRRGFTVGPHALPLMGCGDWNDGMNKVGDEGRGESVWVGWFLLVLLSRFLPLMERRGDQAQADELRQRADQLRAALEQNAWDGNWYRRAYFDDGQPLGSATNDECQIDSIAQTWAVMAQAEPTRSRAAIEAVWERLVVLDEQLVLLFTPPFDKSTLDPGYIKGYLPGIRENGGQYTHPALWLIEALTLMGDGERAMQIFDLINPIHHAADPKGVQRYQVEPYVIAADVYGVQPHTGRGGWTWYTGSAAWTYRAALEFILGIRLRGDTFTLQPCVPSNWNSFELFFRQHGEIQHIRWERGQAAPLTEQLAEPEQRTVFSSGSNP
jgi:cyclic beta-1,2-glucan synthetase